MRARSEKAGGQGESDIESRARNVERLQKARARRMPQGKEEEGQKQRNEKTTKRGERRRGEHADIRRKGKGGQASEGCSEARKEARA